MVDPDEYGRMMGWSTAVGGSDVDDSDGDCDSCSSASGSSGQAGGSGFADSGGGGSGSGSGDSDSGEGGSGDSGESGSGDDGSSSDSDGSDSGGRALSLARHSARAAVVDWADTQDALEYKTFMAYVMRASVISNELWAELCGMWRDLSVAEGMPSDVAADTWRADEESGGGMWALTAGYEESDDESSDSGSGTACDAGDEGPLGKRMWDCVEWRSAWWLDDFASGQMLAMSSSSVGWDVWRRMVYVWECLARGAGNRHTAQRDCGSAWSAVGWAHGLPHPVTGALIGNTEAPGCEGEWRQPWEDMRQPGWSGAGFVC